MIGKEAIRRALPLLVLGLLLSCPAQSLSAPKAPPRAEAEEAEIDVPAQTMLLSNGSRDDIVAVRMTDGAVTLFGRLDLAPGGEEEIDNPGGVVSMRMDMGLSLCAWDSVPLDGVASITLCPLHDVCLEIQGPSGSKLHLKGSRRSLLPERGTPPVCSLSGFRPGMSMKDACGLAGSYDVMEENVYLASLEFAGIVWSARLYAAGEPGTATEDAKLESVELRQRLTKENLAAVQKTLKAQRHMAWQAAFPGIELTFTEMFGFPQDVQEDLLSKCSAAFLSKGRGTAAILYAPEELVKELATSDFPTHDSQLFTLSLHRDAETLVLDITAYSVEDLQQQ